MTTTVLVVAGNEARSLIRDGTVVLLICVFLLMALASAYIGWSSQETIGAVYRASAEKLRAEGRSVPDDPFKDRMPLAVNRNMAIYVVMIGSLLAVTVGYSAGMRDRKAAVTKLVFSRPLSRGEYFIGKAAGVSFVLLVTVSLAYASGLVSSALLAGSGLTLQDIALFSAFYVLSFLYMLGFGLMGLFFAFLLNREDTALLIPVVIWLSVSIVLPQLTSALYPTGSLNPVTDQSKPYHNEIFDGVSAAVKPFSLSEHYKDTSGRLLEVDGARAGIREIANNDAWNISSIIVWNVLWLAACFFAVKRFNAAEGDIHV